MTHRFENRERAGRQLGEELARKGFGSGWLVLGLPRGGVPVAVQVAKKLGAPLDMLGVRKIGAPGNSEFAIGAIAGEDPMLTLDDHLARRLGVSPAQIEEVVAQETAELNRRETLYRAGRPMPILRGRQVLLVDDGLATGLTMLAACRLARRAGARLIAVAAPVASTEACHRLSREADDCVYLITPDRLHAVGDWYVDFAPLPMRK